MKYRSLQIPLLLVCAVLGSRMLLAQYQVNRAPAVGQVNPQLNTELYGRGIGPPTSTRYTPASTSVAMASEVRYAYWMSGQTPSGVRANYYAIGPMAAGGPLSYVTGDPGHTSRSAPPPPPMGAAAYSTGQSVRYSGRSPNQLPAPSYYSTGTPSHSSGSASYSTGSPSYSTGSPSYSTGSPSYSTGSGSTGSLTWNDLAVPTSTVSTALVPPPPDRSNPTNTGSVRYAR
jgi:hypothetical protein